MLKAVILCARDVLATDQEVIELKQMAKEEDGWAIIESCERWMVGLGSYLGCFCATYKKMYVEIYMNDI